MYFNFKNVFGTAAQRTLVTTDLNDSVVIPEGAYSIASLNRYLLEVAGALGPFVKIMAARDGISGYDIRKYTTKADL